MSLPYSVIVVLRTGMGRLPESGGGEKSESVCAWRIPNREFYQLLKSSKPRSEIQRI